VRVPIHRGMTQPANEPLAAPAGRRVARAEPAKIIGWLLLGAVGTYGLVEFAVGNGVFGLYIALACYGVVAGFVQAHRHPGTLFAKVWIGAFGTLAVIAYLIAKFAPIPS
jgi:hypothetical protein